MKRLLINIEPTSDFGSVVTGAQLFGQTAWAVREVWGEERLNALLQGYADGRPFLVLSDAMPAGFVPIPLMPLSWWAPDVDAQSRKRIKALKWLPREALADSIDSWSQAACSDSDLAAIGRFSCVKHERMHNTICRATNTTGEGVFAPFSSEVISYGPGTAWDVYAVIDEDRISLEELKAVLDSVGAYGFGADASSGMGKFTISRVTEVGKNESAEQASHFVTLADMAPVAASFDSQRTFYHPHVYFGRHGNIFARGETPFKKPLLLAKTGAFLTPLNNAVCSAGFAGCGITGHSAHAQTVHQGYAPVLPIPGCGSAAADN